MPTSGAHPTLRFLVIGCGSIGKRHLRNLKLLNAGEILACDPREDRRREASTRFDVEVPATLTVRRCLFLILQPLCKNCMSLAGICQDPETTTE